MSDQTNNSSGETSNQGPNQTQDLRANTADGEVYLLARVKAEYAADLRTSLIRAMRIIPNYGGRILGISEPVKVLENGLSPMVWANPMCMLVLQFPSRVLADRWSFSDPIFKEKDFPHACASIEIIAIPMTFIPSSGYRAFQMTTFKVGYDECERFQTEYVDEAAKFYQNHNVCYGVTMTQDILDIRFGWVGPDEYVSIHTFPSEELLLSLYNDSEYEKLKGVMNCLTVSTTVAFTIK